MYLTEYKQATEFYVLFMFAIFLISPILPTFLKGQGLTDIELGILYSLMPLFLIFITPALGKLSDALGRNRIIYGIVIVEIIAFFSYSFISHWAIIALTRLVDGLCVTTIGVLSIARIEDTVSKRRGSMAGTSLSIEYLGRLIAPLIGGFIADYFFIRAPFLVTLAILCLSLILLHTDTDFKRPIRRKDLHWMTNIKTFLSYKELRGIAILGATMHATQPALVLYLPLYITEFLGLSHSYVGYALFVLGLMHLFQFWFGQFADKRPKTTVLTGCLFTATLFILLGFSKTYVGLLLFLLIMGTGRSIWNIGAWTLMSKIGELHNIEGQVVGSYVSLAKIGGFMSYLVSGFLLTALGFNALFIASGIVLLLGVLISSFFFKDLSQKVKHQHMSTLE